MSTDEPKRRLSVHDVIGALGDLPPGEDSVSVIRKQRDAADRPSVTDNARAEAERRYGTPRESDLLPSDYVTIGQIEGYVEGRLAAGRAETTTAALMARRGGKTQALIESLLAQAEDRGLTVEVVYPETTTATTEDAARVIDDACYGGASSPQEIAQALADAGLLATARTRPTREQIARAIDDEDTTPCAVCDDDWCYYCRADALRMADAVLALLADQPDPADVWDQGYQAGADGGYLGDALSDNPYRGGGDQ